MANSFIMKMLFFLLLAVLFNVHSGYNLFTVPWPCTGVRHQFTDRQLGSWCSRSSTKSIIFPYNIWCVCECVCVIIDPNREKSSIWSTRPILIVTVFCLLFKLWANLTQKACNHLLYILYSGKLLADTREAPASCKEGSHSPDRCKQSTYGHPQKG